MRSFTLLSCCSLSDIICANTVRSLYTSEWLLSIWLPCVLDASFSENFYGLKRRRRPWIGTDRAKAAFGGIPAGEKLRSREIWRSLVFLVSVQASFHAVTLSYHLQVCVPYLRAKAHDYYEELGGGIDSDILEDGRGNHQLGLLTDNVSSSPNTYCLKAHDLL
jgi:Pex2 / Pex12 amino terminal region